jgi:cardiolipin synthase (CMP-forming)
VAGFLNIPNLLSAGRLALAPFVAQAIVHGAYLRALAIFVVAGASDALDGMLARQFRWSTAVGAYLDPISDKVLLVAVYLSLGVAHLAPWWLVGIVFGRDAAILLVAGGALVLAGRRNFAPSVWGKISTFVQILTAIMLIAGPAFPSSSSLRFLGYPLVLLTAATTTWSGVHYAWTACRLWRTPLAILPD